MKLWPQTLAVLVAQWMRLLHRLLLLRLHRLPA